MFVRRERGDLSKRQRRHRRGDDSARDREPNGDRELAGIVTLAHEMDEKESVSFALAQSGDELVFRLGTSLTGPPGSELFSLGRLSTSEPTHVIVSYRPGRLAGYVNGKRVLDTRRGAR